MKSILFRERTPLGWAVEAVRAQWVRISTIKHRSMRGREAEVARTLREPEQIRRSRKDPAVFLFYRVMGSGRWICAVAKQVDDENGFLITAYPTESIKQGEVIWRR